MRTKNRVRVTKVDIAKAREELLSQPKVKRTKETQSQYIRDKWLGVIYCDSYGLSWVADKSLKTVCVGRTDELLKAVQQNKIDVKNTIELFIFLKQFQTEKKNPKPALEISGFDMCHSASSPAEDGITAVEKSICATFITDPKFLKLIDNLISEDFGILTIQSRLKRKGYEVPYRTLGRWVKGRKVAHG